MEIETQLYITNLLKTNPKIVENNLNYNDKKFNKKKEYYQLKEHIDTFLPSSVRRYRRPLWASSLMQTIRLCSFKSVSTLLTCFIPTPDSSLIFVGILTSFFKVSSTFRL